MINHSSPLTVVNQCWSLTSTNRYQVDQYWPSLMAINNESWFTGTGINHTEWYAPVTLNLGYNFGISTIPLLAIFFSTWLTLLLKRVAFLAHWHQCFWLGQRVDGKILRKSWISAPDLTKGGSFVDFPMNHFWVRPNCQSLHVFSQATGRRRCCLRILSKPGRTFDYPMIEVMQNW